MGKVKKKAKHVTRVAGRKVGHVSKKSARTAKKAIIVSARTAKRVPKTKAYQKAKAGCKTAHKQVAQRPHEKLMARFKHYAWWHNWQYKKLHHGHVHRAALASYTVVILAIVLHNFGFVFAADISDNWDFSNPSNFTFDTALETDGSSARLKGQGYTADGNTAALYHLNEGSGTTVNDASANNNGAATVGSPAFAAGNIDNGLTLNGSGQYATAPDSPSLSITGQQTVEAWIKPNATFDSSADRSQTIVDKGSYRLGLDRTSGKAFYEIQNSDSETWTKRLGDEQSGSWSDGHASVESSIAYGSDVYVGTGNSTGDAEVWKWNGSTWSKVGGDGLSGSWMDAMYEGVYSLATNGTALYAGLGLTQGDAEVWTCNLSTNCSSWTKIGGDGNGPGGTYVSSMVTHAGSLYVGTTASAGGADVFKYEGNSTWTQVGGDGLRSSWAVSTFEAVSALRSDGANLYAGLGTTTGDAEVWSWNGTAWTKIGGDGVGGSWNTNYELVNALHSFGGSLYAGLGSGANDAEVWRYSGGAWTQVGGDGLNSSWSSSNHTNVYTFANDGTNLFAATGNGSGAAEVWSWNGATWVQIGGDGINGSFSTSIVSTLLYVNSKLYAGAWSSTAYGSAYWEYSGGAWTLMGGGYVNDSWGGYDTSRVSASTAHNGKAYFGLGNRTNTAQVYEYDGTTTRRIGGNGKDGSWASWTYEEVSSLISYKGDLYAGLGNGPGEGEVWKWDGSTWIQVGGDGVGSSWNSGENIVYSMAVFNGSLYVGLGYDAYEGDIWQYNNGTWTQVAGTAGSTISPTINGSWSVTGRGIESMVAYDGKLCAGFGGQGGTAQVWCWNGSGNWTQIANNNGLNGSWSNLMAVGTLAVWNGKLYAGVGTVNGHRVSVWEWNGSTWTQIAGGGLNGTWMDGEYSYARSLVVYNGSLYLGAGYTGSSNSTADIWRWNDGRWTQVAGDGINGSWAVSEGREEVATMLAFKGKLYAGLGFSANTDALVYSLGNNAYMESTTNSFDSSWKHIAATYDGIAMKLFINGVQNASRTVAVGGIDTDDNLMIGTNYGSTVASEGQQYFDGQLDEIRVSNVARTSFNAKPYVDTAQTVSLAAAVHKSGVESWDGFSADETTSGGSITYRLSDDGGETWKYWNGSSWVLSTTTNQANPAAGVSANINEFPVTFDGIKWQAILKGDGNQRVTLHSVTLTANSDTDAPGANASGVNAYVSNGGASIASDAWTNSAAPYFTWDAAADAGSGIHGYCLYLGQTSSADPVSTKGLLGTSPVATGDSCQFLTTETSLNLAATGILGTNLSTSSSQYYLNIKAIDKAGNIFGTSEQFQFKFDNTPPSNPAFITAPSEFVSNKEVTFSWPTIGNDAASDNDSGVAGLQYRIGSGGQWRGDGSSGDGILANDGSYTTRSDPDFPDISNGNNVFYFRTFDQAGNATTGYVSATLRLNTGSPSSPQNVSVTPQTNTANSFAFVWDAPATFAGNANDLTYCYAVNTLPTVSTCTYTAAGVTSLPAGAYATQPGENTFYVVAKDNNINYATAASITFTANTSAPGMPLDLEVADVSTKATSTWRLALSWNAPTNAGAGVANYRIYRSTDNNTFAQIASTSGTSHVDSGLSQTTYYYKIRACDSANNCGAFSQSISKLPTGRFTTAANMTAQPLVSGVSTKKATVRWSTDRLSDSKILIGTKSGAYEPFQIASAEQVTDHVVELANLTPGTTYFAKATWTDEDGNTGLSSEFSFKTEAAPSTQEVITQQVGLASAQVRFTSVSAAKVVVQYGKTDSFGGVKEIATSLSKSTYTIELTGLDDGTKYLYRLNTFDAEGNEYAGSTVLSFTTPARPRISNLRFQPVQDEPTSTQKVTWTTNVPSSSFIRFSSEGIPTKELSQSKLVTEHEIIIRDLLDNTKYSLVAESRDEGGNLAVSDIQTLRTALDTRPPKISDVIVETTIRGTGAEARGQIVVSWKTDEPATSQVAYGEGSQLTVFNNRTAEDSSLATEHIVIVSDLPTSRVYSVQPVSEDRGENSGTGEIKSAIIGKASDSVLTIVLDTLKKVFGF